MLKSNSKKIFVIALLLFVIMSLSAVSAEDASDIGNSTVASTDAVAQSATQVSAVQDAADTIQEVSTDDSSTIDITDDIKTDQSNDKLDGADTIDTVSSNADKKNLLTSTKLEDEDHVIYVSPYGPDDADGTMLKSYNTIKKALDSMNETGHYTIVLRNGTYTGINNTSLNISRDNLTIKAYDRAKVTIDNYQSYYGGWNITGSNIEIQGIIFNRTYSSSRHISVLNTENVTISGCTFANASSGYSPLINVTDSKNVAIEDSTFNKISTSTSYYVIGALRSDVTIKGNEFVNLSTSPISLTNSNANISENHFDNFTSYYGIYSSNSNSTIENNIFENRNGSSYYYYSTVYLSNSKSNISGNTFKNINLSYSGNGHAPIYVYSSSVANISDNDFINTYAYYGGAIENPSANTIVENNRFTNTTAYYGGAIYNTGTNLTLTGNTATGTNATQGAYVYNNYSSGSINTVNVTFLNNETVTTDSYLYPISILVTDDMGNKIFGKTVSVYLNDTSRGTVSVGDYDVNMSIVNPGQGTYLVNGNYSGALNSNVKTGVIEFLDTYKGPFYVATNGSDTNNGDKDHPFATIQAAIRAASVTNNTPVIYINEGTYYENNLSVSTGLNITGLGNVTIDGSKGGRILYVSGANTNISNINFENSNFTVSTSSAYGGAVYWAGANGTLNNASFSNNLLNDTYNYYYSTGYGGAVYWAGANGTINNTSFVNNSNRMYSGYSYGGAVYWSGANGTIANSTFDDNTAYTASSSYNRNGGAVYWAGSNGHLTDNKFDNNTAYYGATIVASSNNLTLSGNEISNPNGNTGKYIYASNDYASINGAVITILNNSTVNTSMPYVDCLVTVTDDMGNPIYGGNVNVTLNGTNVITGRTIYENTTVTINSPGIGEYLVVPKYYHYYANPNDNYTAKTAVINWNDEPYNGPFYVATNGSDANRGDEDHPFATIEAAIKAANSTQAVPAIYIKEGTYKESDLNITKPVNITGIGKVIIDAEGNNDILNISASYVNITNVGFANGNSSTDGGAIYWSGNYGKLENSTFINNTAADRGGSIYNRGNYLKLSGNNITNSNASLGKSIYNNGSINGTTLILMHNDTVVLDEGVTAADISIQLVDDMNNSIAGGYVNVTLNKYNATLMQNLTDDMVITVFSPAYGEYLVNGSYRSLPINYNPDYNNYTVETGRLTFQTEPYFGPYYVGKNGSDYYDGTPEHPFATIEQAIKAASQEDVVPAIYVYEGVYDESNLNVTKPMNITGLGDVLINANGSSNIFDVKADNVNVSNIGFENANANGNGAAIKWSGVNGTLNNATFINNSASTAGAVYWTGTNGTLVNSTFINNTASDRGGALVYVGNLNVTNNTFINNSAVNEGGAIFTNKTGPQDMANSTFVNNSARLGGAVFVDYNNKFTPNLYNNTHFNILDSSFVNNTAQDGGAVVLYASNSTIRNSTFIGNNATRYGDGAISSGGENNTIINNTFINNTAFLYAGAIGSNSSKIINNTFINNSAYQAGAILTINDTIINNTFEGNNATIGKSIVYLQNYNLTNITCNCSLDNYECCDENCSCADENFTGVCNCTNHTVVDRYSVLINNTLNNSEVYVYHGSPIMNVTLNYNGHYIISLDGAEQLGADGYCIEFNNSMPWEINGTTGIAIDNTRFIRNSLDGSYVGDYVKVAILLRESFQRWNIKELIFAFTDEDYMNSDDPDVQYIIDIVNDPHTILRNGDNWINGEWYCGDFYTVIHPTTRQNLVIVNGCGEIDLPHLTPEKEANVTTVQDGDYVNYTITVTNDEEIYLHNVTVRDIPDSALSFIGWNNTLKSDGTPEDWIKDEDSLIWYLNRTLLPGETVTFYAIFKASVPYNGKDNLTYDIVNTINVTSYETNWDAADEVIQGLRPYLIIRKDTLDTNVSVGSPVRFMITVTNIGDAVAREVHVYESGWSGYGLNYLGWANGYDNHTWTYGPSSYNWYLNEPLNPKESASFIVIFNATHSGTMFANTAVVYNPNAPTEVSTNYTNVSYVYLGAYKTVARIDGELITFALTVTNNGNSTAYGAYISESNSYTFPLVNWTDARGAYMNSHWNYNGPSVGSNFNSATWTLQDPLGPGGSATILLTLNSTFSSSYFNSITVGDKDGSKNGTGTNGGLIRYLGAYKTVIDVKDDIISFMLTVTNQGNITAHNVTISDYLYDSSTSIKFINWTDSRGYSHNSDWRTSFYRSGSYLYYDFVLQQPLGPGGSASVILTFNTTDAGGFSNSMSVRETNGFSNGTGTGGGLTRYLNANKYVVDVKDDIITFALTVTNVGNITAHDVYIRDSLSNYGDGRTLTYINWTDARGANYNSRWIYNGTSSTGSYIYYTWTLIDPLGPGGSATILLTFNTTNASGYGNGINVGEKNGFTNGNGTGGPLTRYIGAYKTVLEQSGDTIKYLLTITNNGNITLHDVALRDTLQHYYYYTYNNRTYNKTSNMTFIEWYDVRGSQYNSDWIYNGTSSYSTYTMYNWTLIKPLGPGGSASIVAVFNISNALAYNNGMSVNDKTGYGNGTGISGNITRDIGAYKTVVEIKDDIIIFALTVTNNGNTTLENVSINENPYGPYLSFVNWTDSRGPNFNSDWTYSLPSKGSTFTYGNWKLNYGLAPGAARTILLTLNTTNASGYNNGISVSAYGTGNGTGLGGPLIRYLGAYKTVLEQKDDFITYMLTITNQGNITAHEAYIQESLSAPMSLINWTDSRGSNMNSHWIYSGPSVGSSFNSARWTLQDPLGPGGSASIILKLNTTLASGYTNSITVGEKNGFTNGTGVSNGIYRYLGAYKSVLDQNTTIGEPVRFMLTVTNYGNTTADMVYIQDTPYGPMNLLNWTDSRGSQFDSKWSRDGSSYKWTYADPLQPGGSLSLILTFNVTSNGTFSNGMSVGDRFGSRNGTGLSFNVSNIYLGAYKELLDETIVYGEPVRFLLAVTNYGNGTAHDVFIQESPSLSTLQFLNWTDSRGSKYNSEWNYDGNYKWTYKNPLGAGGTASIVVTFNVTAQSSSPTARPGISNGMTVGDQYGTKNGTGNGWGIEYTPLGIYKNALNETPIRQGDNLSFLITVKNNGNGTAHHVWINETPDWDSLEFLNWTSMDSHSWTFNGTFEYNQTVYVNDEPVNVTKKCLIFTLNDELAADESANLKLTFNVTAPNGGTSNSVTTGDNSTPSPKNGTGWNGYITNEILGLAKAIVDEGKVIYAGGEAKFIITVTNIPSGPDAKALEHIFVVEDAPAGLEYQNFTVVTGEEENRLVGTWTHMVNDEGKHVFYLEEGLEGGYFSQIEVTFIANEPGNFTNKVNGSSDTVNNTTEENFTVYNASLAVEKIALDPVVYVGNTTSFMIVVHNTGNVNLTSVVIEEVPQDGIEYKNFTSEDDKWTYDVDTHKFIYNDVLLPGASTNFTVIFNTTRSGTFINTVVPSSNETSNRTENSTNNTTVYSPKLAVEKITLNETVYNGNITQFTIVVTNVGDCNLTEVFVKEESYEGLTYVDFVDETGKWSYDEDTHIFTYDGILGVEASANFTVLFNTTKSGNFTNVVVAGSNETGNETTENKTEVLTPALDVYKYANNATVYNGNITEFTVVVTNTGDCNLTGVFVEEQIPDGLTYVDFVDETGKWSYDEETHVFTYDGTLVPEEVVKFIILFNTTRSGNFTNVIVYGSNQTGNDTNESNNTTVYTPKMEVIKIASDKVVYVGNTTSYTIEVTNTGDCNLTEVFVEEEVPEGLSYLTYVDKVGHWNYDGNYKWTYDGVLAPEETVSFIVIFNTTVSMNITNVVVAGSNETGNKTTENNTTVVYSPKLNVIKIANDEFVYSGNITSFSIVVTNIGDCDLTGVFVKEEFPEGLVYDSLVDATGKWSYDAATTTFNYDGSLEAGDYTFFVLIFNTTKSGNFTNVVVAGSNETGNETTNNSTVVYSPDFVVVKVANDEVVYVGNTTSYTITVTNTGDCNLSDVFVDDKTPEGLVYLGYDKESEWTYDGSSVWTYTGVLAPGESASLVITYNTTKSMNITNVVIAGNNQTGNKTTENNTTVVYSPDFVVIKVANDEVVYVGNTTSYTITVTNTGDCNLSNVFVDDKTPEGLVYLGYTDEAKWTYDGSSVWTYTGVLAPGESASLVITYNTTKSMNITNVVIAGNNQTGNKTTENNTTVVYSPDFVVIKVANDEVVYVGNTTSYTITVTNTGDCNLSNVFVDDKTPEGLVYLGYTDEAKWTYDGSSVWTYTGVLAPGESASLVITYNTTKSMNIDNVVIAGNNQTGNKTTNNNTTNVFSPDFEVIKVATDDVVYSGNITSFTIVVSNTGDCALTGVFVKENFPDGLTYLGYSSVNGKWTFDESTQVYSLVDSLDVDSMASFMVFFNTSQSGNFTNPVEAGSNLTGNKTSNDTVTVYNPGLTVQKITLNETVYVGEKTQFLIHVINTGDCDLTGVYVIEKSFPGLKYGSYVDYDGKWSFDGKNKWTYKGTLAPGESADFIVIFDTSIVGNFTNTVEAGSNQTGPEEADNDTEVIDKEVPNKKEGLNKEPTPKHGGKLSSIKSGNPLFALLLVFAILGLTPLRRKRE